jgi:chemotaxis response regulator CheB
MSALKIAVLEDDKTFLTVLVRNLRTIEGIKVVAFDQTSSGFIQKVRDTQPDILVLDIELKGESTTGINVSELFNLPTIFFSSVKGSYSDAIDNQKYKKRRCPVEEYGKTFDREKVSAIFEQFIPRVQDYQKTIKAKVKPIGEDEIMILTSDVSVIESDKGTGNHIIRLLNLKPIKTADTTFNHFRSIGFTEEKFYKLGKSLLWNISNTYFEDGCLKAKAINKDGDIEEIRERVPPEKVSEVRKVFLK